MIEDEFLRHDSAEKELAPGPDGLPYREDRCPGNLDARLMCTAYKALLVGVFPSHGVASSRTVFTPKSSGWNHSMLCCFTFGR